MLKRLEEGGKDRSRENGGMETKGGTIRKDQQEERQENKGC